ncbi:MAG: hypothetical protein QM730_05470 [Anaerolineales bacterium]
MQTIRSNIGICIGGAVLIIFGFFSLVSQLFRSLNLTFLWSLIVILIGISFFIAMVASQKRASALAIPGTIVSGVGLVMLIQSLTRHWNVAPYFWTLIILFLGAGIYIMGWHSSEKKQKETGLRFMKIGLILFIVFGAFFEVVFTNIVNFIILLLLITAGTFLVLSFSGLLTWKKNASNELLPPTN